MANITDMFPEIAKEARRKLGISQEELAHALGVSFSTVNRWENGKTGPSKLAQRRFEQFCKEQNIDPLGRIELKGN